MQIGEGQLAPLVFEATTFMRRAAPLIRKMG